MTDTTRQSATPSEPEPWPQRDLPTTPTSAEPAAGAPSASNSWMRLVALAVGIAALGLIGGVSVLLIVLAIVVSIFLHELGHFLVAKRAGMKVTEFFIGFGPRIWSFHRGETEYGVKAIPAGAYVRIIGMHNLEQVDPADESRTYRAQSYGKRLPVVLAGPFANFAIAFVLLFAIFVGWGSPNLGDWTVDRVLAGSAAAEAGLQPGDRIVSFNGQPVSDFAGLSELIEQSPDEAVEIVYEREGREATTSAVLGWRLSAEAAAAVPPLEAGDQVVAVNGRDVDSYAAFAAGLAASDAGPVTVVFQRQGFPYETEVNAPAALPVAAYDGFLGVGPAVDRERMSPVAAVGEAGSSFGSVVTESVGALGKVFSPSGIGAYVNNVTSATSEEAPATGGAIRPLDVNGPHATGATVEPPDENRLLSILGVIRLGSQAADSGWIALMWLLVMVNIFLGLFNLLPLPPLDGGHAAVATYEAVREKISGKPYRVDISKLMPVTYAMVFLILAIGVTSLYLDIVDPVQNPFGP